MDEPAFPNTHTYQFKPGDERIYRGMTLRDYFAGQAIAGMCANATPMTINGVDVHYEKAAYMIADAMLKAKEKST